MEIRPILSAMLRNKTGAILVGLQIALTLAVIANAAFIIMQRVEKITSPPGFDSDNLVFVESYGFGPQYDHRDTVRRDLDLIRSLPGVVAASVINHPPLSFGTYGMGVGPAPQREKITIPTDFYTVDDQAVEALGVQLVAGRGFTEQEVQYSERPNSDFVPAVIITRKLARALFGDDEALGRRVYESGEHSAVVVGVIEDMQGGAMHWDDPARVMLIPRIISGPLIRYVVRAEPGRLDSLVAELDRKLSESNTSRAINWVRTHAQIKARSFAADTRMVTFLCVISALMICITALSIVGLASFYVNTRTRQIGTRRAIGARRMDIIRYFLVENWLLTTGGIVAGAVFSFLFGQWLSATYSLPRLEPVYVGAGAGVLWVLGQLAAFLPARRAADIPPAVATRSV